ncbi:Crp/Fnr family transcriptional regulator [candidate division LCP-89 bacterium B3_LCP]|uniref:Crp/Fnr family transcriptional regulator n=1 Tax=candidate division LCP-89 bacterium B3_LCP TaxID=2012998 RepID=A0A532V5R2_UNCL8|nr:MAG: Crp/Fnr family transcriptional regulator [candidate division LCP-89 bacterium B3_LCP]
MGESRLKAVPLFADLDDDSLEDLDDLLTVKRYKKNNLIIFEDDRGLNLFIIYRGRVKISRISEDGGEVILAILGEGEFFGELSVIDGLSRSATVTALDEVELLVMKREEFYGALETHPQISIFLLKELAGRIRKSDTQIKSLSLRNAKGRVATTLIRLAEDIGRMKAGRVIIPELPLQRDLANIAGTSRETISRVIAAFEKEGHCYKKESALVFDDFERFKHEYM